MHLWRSSNFPRLPSILEMPQNPHVLLTFEKVHIPCACHATRHLNVQKWSKPLVLLTFWLRNVLRATTACIFSTSQLPKVLRTWGGFCFFTCKCASRHNGVYFFISHLARWLRTRCFSEPTFRPSGATNHWKTQCFATFLPFRAPASSFFLTLALLWSSLFYSSLLSDSSHLCLSSVHIVGSLTSKLPSNIQYCTKWVGAENTNDGGIRPRMMLTTRCFLTIVCRHYALPCFISIFPVLLPYVRPTFPPVLRSILSRIWPLLTHTFLSLFPPLHFSAFSILFSPWAGPRICQLLWLWLKIFLLTYTHASLPILWFC